MTVRRHSSAICNVIPETITAFLSLPLPSIIIEYNFFIATIRIPPQASTTWRRYLVVNSIVGRFGIWARPPTKAYLCASTRRRGFLWMVRCKDFSHGRKLVSELLFPLLFLSACPRWLDEYLVYLLNLPRVHIQGINPLIGMAQLKVELWCLC
jgi:hypothetical protein